MAAVIAHEVKNPLAGIRGAVQVIGSRLPADSRDGAIIGDIVARIDTLNGLIQDLLLFARPPQPKMLPIEVRPLIQMTAALLAGDPSAQHVHVEIGGSSPVLLADPEMLKIVFLNLLINGAHAMREGGEIYVSVETEEAICTIAFTDSGPGIPPDIRERIFTPFFTTKSRGTGLGLPTAKRLVEAHRGTITVNCPPDGGTTVTVRLPLAEMPAGSATAGPILEPA